MPIDTDDFDWRLPAVLGLDTIAGGWCRAATVIGNDASSSTSVIVDDDACGCAISLCIGLTLR